VRHFLLVLIFLLPAVSCAVEVDKVVVDKSESKLFLMKGRNIVQEFHVVFGANPKGHKQQEGDERTPEGLYILDYKKKDSSFYRAIHISYPNKNDKKRAQSAGVNPGGQIMIHGQKNGLGWLSFISQLFDWTNGCIAVNNSDMDTIWKKVKAGTSIEIKP